MKKNLVQTALSLFMLITFSTSVYPQWTPTNLPAGNSFFNLYTGSDRVFARTWDSLNGGRMFLTADNGSNWTQVSPADGNSDILSIVRLNNSMLAGTWNGFYLSNAGGTSWNAVTPAGIPADTAIWSIVMINTTLFAGTKGDIFKSSDSGTTWVEIKSGIPASARIKCIIANGNALFAGSDTSGIFMTINNGTSWTAVNSGLADKHLFQLAVIGNKIFAVTLTGVFVSVNNGASWAAYNPNLGDINCLLAANYQLFAGTDSSGVYLSVDSGATWTLFSSGMPAGTRVWSLTSSSGNIFAGTSAGVWRTPADTAHFTITAVASEGGTIAPQGDISVCKYGSRTLTIAPATGYRIGNVSVDGVSAGAVASYTFSNVTANHTISAVFTTVPTYAVTASAGNGGTISPSGTMTVSEGSSATFAIIPLTGYAIATVTVDGSPVGAVPTYTFTNVTGDHTISAAFVSAPYTITASAGSGGSISPAGTVTVPALSSQTFTITPSTGYEVSSVLVDGASAGAVFSYTFLSVTSSHTISVSFSPLTKYQINCGGSASSPYNADQYFGGGSTYSVTSAITTTGVTNPAPQAVYQTERYGAMTYTIPSLTSGASYKVRLHFSENFMSASGKRKFNVAINGTTVLSNYDIYAETGARYKAVVKEYAATANTSGQIVINFTNVTDNAKIDGIEIIKLITNIAPTIAAAASATPSPVTGTATALSVLGADDNGESNLTYTWTITGTPPAPVTFTANGTNAAKATTVTFTRAGNYSFQVTVTDAGGLTATSTVSVTVNQTFTSIALSPAIATVNASATRQFTATARDQFATALSTQPAFTWSLNGGGTLDANGLFTAGTTSGTCMVTATSGSVSGTATVTVNTAPVIAAAASALPNPAAGSTAALSVLGADDNSESNLTYTWAATGNPPASVMLSVNGTNAAKATTVTFSKAGSYTFQVTVTDQGGLTATSTVVVTVDQTLTSIMVSPAGVLVNASGTQQFTATACDQFLTALPAQPAFAWSVNGGGTMDANGLFTAGTTAGSFTVTASSAGVSGATGVTVVVPNTAPTIAAAASASPSPVIAATTSLSVLGADDHGESNLTYTWATAGTPPAPVTFGANGTNAAKNTAVTFTKSGSYTFQVMVTDAGGLTTTSTVSVTVNQTLTSIVLSPTSATVNTSATQQFTATARDQFAAALSTQPAFTWSVSGGGTISSSGLFTAGTTAGGPFTVTAQSGGKSGTANVTVASSQGTRYEAENATLSGGAAKNTNHTGYSGTGFVDGYYNSTTAQTSFAVTISSAGSYAVKLHYSAGNGASTNTGLYVNGTKIKNITCPVTANWNTWADESETITLNAGNNTIAYKAVTSSTSCINLDYISVSK